ncbi:two component transcriptional regulator, LytTR family [Chitinophaga ginsengisegetis]|uniref:Two component transcriptional regulator, LytTR family n=1 Tax=Chitinophaga ginsengisegetis TaxID=393003 RepID=A0A1T5NG66_9BACT|nr:LytTR family DNA-binding domain-containing protein [Chitinophaga ginsengisegetis]SKC99193.1 two component transcriptional regulator, LytTR family [Chitinophaga ginsengisegetis]
MSSTKIKCLIVDDEPIGREIIEGFVEKIPGFELLASCEDAFEALEILQREPVDLLFSDIQMPKVNGLELVRSLPNPPAIIFITAYDNFAVDSYELNITDYLLKPVSYERFLKAVNKAVVQIKSKQEIKLNAATENPFIFLKAEGKLNKILLSEILYIESIKDYIKIHTLRNTLLVYSSMKAIEAKLPVDKFYRIHQSYIVSLDHIKSLMGNVVELNTGLSLPVAKSQKSALYRILNIGEGI